MRRELLQLGLRIGGHGDDRHALLGAVFGEAGEVDRQLARRLGVERDERENRQAALRERLRRHRAAAHAGQLERRRGISLGKLRFHLGLERQRHDQRQGCPQPARLHSQSSLRANIGSSIVTRLFASTFVLCVAG